jgi:hypothetical protein
MRTLTLLVLSAIMAAGLVVSVTPEVSAQTAVWAVLTGYEETPALSTKGNGVFRGVISADQTSIAYTLVYFDVESTVSFAHIHLGQPGVAGGIAAFLCGGGGKAACPATSGTVTGTITATDVTGPASQGLAAGEFAELIRAILAGATYANVHSATFGAGEIRGQIRQ